MKKIVKTVVDLSHRAEPSAEQRARLSRLAKVPDSDIDYSDIPPLSDQFWKSAVRNPFYRTDPSSKSRR